MNMLSVLVVLVFCTCINQIFVDAHCDTQLEVIAADADGTQRRFGSAVSIFGSTAMIGAKDHGAVYVFMELSPGNWSETQKIIASDPQENSFYGIAISLSDTTAFVGSYRDSTIAYNNGAVYVLIESSPGTWVEAQKITASDADNSDQFGVSVTVDGAVAIVGCGENTGVYVFVEVSHGNWIETQKLEPSVPNVNDKFGNDVSLLNVDAVVAAPHEYDDSFNRVGAIYILSEASPGTWVETQKLVSSDEEQIGASVAIGVSVVFVGADQDATKIGAVYVYTETSPGVWIESQKLTYSDANSMFYFGQGISISGSYGIVGAYNVDENGFQSGAAYLFHETSPGNWEEVERFLATKGAENDRFGFDSAINGNIVLIGSNAAESAYFFFLDDVDDCPGNACEHGATCVDAVYDYCCECSPAHGGKLCTECLCENGGVCQDDPDTGVGYCDCTHINYSGNTCKKQCNNGVGETYPATGCNCTLSGATGSSCNKDIDDCESSPCANTGTCSDFGADLFPNHNNEFNCSCDGTGYHGPTCEISDCISSPCLNNGVCEQAYELGVPSGIQCNCSETDYEGDWCQTEVDECASSPCLNDGVCTDLLGDFTCNCIGTGHEGLTCADDVDDCMSSPCEHDGSCEDKGMNKFKCTCNEFWEGDTCSEDVDDCILKGYYCENGAECANDPVNMGDVICTCVVENAGFTGKYCDVPIEDACVTFNPCFNGGKCVLDDITKVMSCDCADTGYEGDVCDVQVYTSECVSSPCLNQGQCYDPSDQDDDWYCVCVNGYFGGLCDLQACDSMPCQNGGTCTNEDDAYTCACPENYSGAQCQVNEDEQVGINSSSSFDTETPGDPTPDDGTTKNDSDAGMLIIIIIIIVVVVGAAAVGGFLWYKKQQATKTFMMPT